MRRTIPLLVLPSLWIILNAATAAARVDVHIGVVAPPPPTIVYESEPQVVVVPNTDVYYVQGAPDYDMYRYGGYWYVVRDGYWYRAPSYRGPFVAIPYERVPHRIIAIPAEYHHHPFRHVNLEGRGHEYHGHGHAPERGHYRDNGRGGGHAHGEDHGHGHGHDNGKEH